MPTVVSSRTLVPIGRRIRNAPEDSDASKAIVLRRKQQNDTEDLSKALIIRPSHDAKDDRQAWFSIAKRVHRKCYANLLVNIFIILPLFSTDASPAWHKSSALLPPFKLDDLLRIADSQFMACLSELQNLQDPYTSLMISPKPSNTLVNMSSIAYRIHNAYFKTAAWKYVRDHAKLLKDLELDDSNIFAQIKANPALSTAYLELHGMLKLIEASGQKELGLLAAATKHYMRHVKESSNGLVWDPEAGLKLHKSLVDTIIIEMVFPQARYELSILMLCLRDAIALGNYKTTDRFDQSVFDAIGDLSVRVSLRPFLPAFECSTLQYGAASHVAGIENLVEPLTKTKTPAVLEKIWEMINQTYVARAGMDVDILWGLEDSMNPEPQWSAWALTSTKLGDDEAEKNRRALVRKTHPRDDLPGRKQRLLAIAAEPTQSDDIPPGLVSDTEDEDIEEWETEDDAYSEKRRKREADKAKEKEKEKEKSALYPFDYFPLYSYTGTGRFLTKDPALSVEPQPLQPDFESDDEQDEHGDHPAKKKKKKKTKKKPAGGAGGDDDMPGLIPTYPYRHTPADLPALIPLSVANERLKAKQSSAGGLRAEAKKPSVTVEELEDPDAGGAGGGGAGGGKKKKKVAEEKRRKRPASRNNRKMKTTTKAGRLPPPPPARSASASASKSPTKTKGAKSPKSPSGSLGGAAASLSSLYTPQPETAQSAQSYLKSEGIAPKSKTKSRPEESQLDKLGSFMSRTFGRQKEEQQQQQEEEEGSQGDPAWEKILGVDDTKGQGGLEWNEFVKAMIELGFEYDESSAGSRVRFDPPDKKDKSYTVHKPHPDPWLHPKRVKDIARDLKKMYGFDEKMLAGLSTRLRDVFNAHEGWASPRSPSLSSYVIIVLEYLFLLLFPRVDPFSKNGNPLRVPFIAIARARFKTHIALGQTMSRQPTTRSMTQDEHWPTLGAAAAKISVSGSKPVPPARSQPACASGNSTDSGQGFAKALTAGVGDHKLTTGAAINTTPPIRITTHSSDVRLSPPPEARVATWSEIARRLTPPPLAASPVLSSAIAVAVVLPKANVVRYPYHVPLPPLPSPLPGDPYPQPNVIAIPAPTDNFPPLPLSPSPAVLNKDTKPGPTRKNSYATATIAAAVTATTTKARPAVNPPCRTLLPNRGEGDYVEYWGASPRVSSARPESPAVAPSQNGLPRASMHAKHRSTPTNMLSPPVIPDAIVARVLRVFSSVATSIATSVITTSSRGPASSKTSVCHTPTNDDTEWERRLTELAQNMSAKERAGWEKILRCDPKDTSKMKWSAFNKALTALGFKAQARGGSETEYTPDPEYFGTKAQPISYHRRK
ncbi:HicA toxin of bacterial toxin-antitoxin [Rhizoctonia solani]|uniref:HicA toxin of bacterial toxin-antitoxin n=1 Tax=Rhizoctonia solani TaxID=456999 RepID=A0A8H7LXN4_9AGAM|nr:HicA toxin of bacterial toxin-antitoxin [Rhizoctonia solani]